jgi:hypothetical protein
MHQAANMVAVILHPKLTLDHLGNAGCGPQIGSIAMRPCTPQEQTQQAFPLAWV